MSRVPRLSIPSRVRFVLLIVLTALPAIYLLAAIQYAAITVPFGDHVDLIRFIVPWYEGNFHFSSLWAPHNHTRPLVYRLVMILNAVATDWDQRSEYLFIYLSIYGTFACFAWLACRIVIGTGARAALPVTLLSISLLAFSPVGHNNHWWSMMFQLDATNFFIALSLALVVIRPESWVSHVVAVTSCWLATYTLTNGFFAFVAVIVTQQLSAPKLFRPERFAVFWAVNLVAAAVCYLPGMHMKESPINPTILQLIEFSLAYLGAPLGGLVWFPYRNMFDLPQSIALNATCGCILLISCALLCWNAFPRVRKRHSAAMVLYAFATFAIISAVATGWARAALDEFGVANANASRYTIFGAYLLLGQIYYVGAGFAQGWWDERRNPLVLRRVVLTLASLFTVAAFVSYGRGWPIYANAHEFNRDLSQAYTWGMDPTPNDKFIHPRPEAVAYLKRELQLLELGPYAHRALVGVPSPVGKFSEPAFLSSRRTVTQRFQATSDGLKRLSFRFVTPNGPRTRNTVTWRVTELGATEPIASGKVNGRRARDWADVRLSLPVQSSSNGRTYELTFDGTGDDAAALCLPLYEPVDGSAAPTVQSDANLVQRGRHVMDLTLEYAK